MKTWKKLGVVLQVALMAGAFGAFADDPQRPDPGHGDPGHHDDGKPGRPDGGKDDKDRPGRHDQEEISWKEFQDRCANPDKFRGDVQRQPQNIVIQCRGESLAWAAEKPGSIPLESSLKVTPVIISDKFVVPGHPETAQFATKPGTCLKYREVKQTVNVERAVGCGDILAMKGSPYEFCANVAGAASKAGSKLVKTEFTGKKINTCGDDDGDHHGNDVANNGDDHDHDHDHDHDNGKGGGHGPRPSL